SPCSIANRTLHRLRASAISVRLCFLYSAGFLSGNAFDSGPFSTASAAKADRNGARLRILLLRREAAPLVSRLPNFTSSAPALHRASGVRLIRSLYPRFR